MYTLNISPIHVCSKMSIRLDLPCVVSILKRYKFGGTNRTSSKLFPGPTMDVDGSVGKETNYS